MARIQLTNNIEEVRMNIKTTDMPRTMYLALEVNYSRGYIEVDREKIELDGFYLIAQNGDGRITIEEEGTNKRVEISNIYIDRVWHAGFDFWITLKVNLTPKDIWKLSETLGTGDILISWDFNGYAYLREEKMRELNVHSIVPITISGGGRRYKISRKDFVKNVLEPGERFKREFLEIVWMDPSKISELLTRITDPKLKDLKDFINLLLKRYDEFLQSSLRKISYSNTPSDYRDIIANVRRFFSEARKIYGNYKDIIRDLYIQTNTLEGEGAYKEASKEADALLMIMDRIETISSGLGIHPETSEQQPEPYISYPGKEDAKYLVLQALIIFDYIMRKIEKLIALKG